MATNRYFFRSSDTKLPVTNEPQYHQSLSSVPHISFSVVSVSTLIVSAHASIPFSSTKCSVKKKNNGAEEVKSKFWKMNEADVSVQRFDFH